MEIPNTIFKVLESRGFFDMAMEIFWIFVWENSKIYLSVLNIVYVMFVHFTICDIKDNPPKVS